MFNLHFSLLGNANLAQGTLCSSFSICYYYDLSSSIVTYSQLCFSPHPSDKLTKGQLCLNQLCSALNINFGSLWLWGEGERYLMQVKNKCVKVLCRVAEVAREHGWHPPKSLDSDENFKPDHTLFCRKLRFVAIYALFFGDLWA